MSLMGGISAGVGVAGMLNAMDSDGQLRQQQKLTDQQVKAQKELGKFNAQQAKMMWDATNYGAQVQHMKDAGLSVSTLMGKGGGGGATTSGGEAGSVTGGQAEGPSAGLMAKTNAMSAIANLDLTKAQVEKTRAEAEKLKGVDTDLSKKQIESLTQGIENQKAVQRLTAVQEDLSELELTINEATFNDVINNVHFIAQQNYQAMKMAGYEEELNKATLEPKIQLVNQELTNAILTSASIQQGITKSKAEVNKMSEEIAQAWKNLEQRGQEINIKQFSEEIKANYPSVLSVLGKEVDDGIQTFYDIFRKNRAFKKGVK